jgi:hypothetical protein
VYEIRCFFIRLFIERDSHKAESLKAFRPVTPHPPRKLGTFPSGEGSGVCRTAKLCAIFEVLCTKFATFSFACTSHKTATNPYAAGLFARWHLIR